VKGGNRTKVLTPFERFDAVARNVLSVSNKTVRAKIEADDLQIVAAIVAELRMAGFKLRIAGGQLIARVCGDRKLSSHERRLAQRLENYFETYPAQVQEIIEGRPSS
jgi:hypothetical protein